MTTAAHTPLLGVNLDHVATLRQARYRAAGPGVAGGAPGGASPAEFGEPDPVRAVLLAELGGADCITLHLREDRRHVNDRDLRVCREVCRVKFNLEMGATDEMVGIALQVKPHMATLVPEGRQEVTTEGGLDVAGQGQRMRAITDRLRGAGVSCSAFIDADERQVMAAHDAGFDWVEIHTGPLALALSRAGGGSATGPGDERDPDVALQVQRLADAARAAAACGLLFNAGHALHYANVRTVVGLSRAFAGAAPLRELHIGHAIVSRAVYVGLERAVRDMKDAIARA